MFGIFKKKTKLEKLEKKYRSLMQESFDLSKVDRKASDAKAAEADEVMKQIEEIKKNENR